MQGISRWALFGASFLSCLPGVRAAESEAGVIAAAVVAGLILLGGIVGVSVYVYYKKGGCNFEDEKQRKKKKSRGHKKYAHRSNGVYPPHPVQPLHVDSRYLHKANGFVQPVPVAPVHQPQIRPAMYPTYHGPPPEFMHAQHMMPKHMKAGTHSGPPTIVIPASFETRAGTVTMRPDPRPVVKTRHYKQKEASRDDRHHHRSKSHDRSRDKKQQEFVIQQSYDGIPVIRPVIYIDDDDSKRHRSKSKSRSKSRERPAPSAKVITIPFETQTAEVHAPERDEEPIVQNRASTRPRTPTPPPPPKSPFRSPPKSPIRSPQKSPERSRASSVTGGLNALRKSIQDHLGDDSDSDDSSNAPSFRWANTTEKAPDPRAGDVMFFPANTEHASTTNTDITKPDDREQVYGYTTVIKSSKRESTRAVTISQPPATSHHENGGYEVPRESIRGSVYETELSKSTRNYNDIGASMSDRLQSLVEDGDKTRFTKFNVGAINFEDDKTEDDEPVQMRVRERPDTPPADFPRDSFHSARPKTPPRDIPSMTPRESTEIPPLDLQTSINSPTDYRQSRRPVSPPHDFPVSPTRPRTPPADFYTPRPPTPPRDIPDTNRSIVRNGVLETSMRSNPVDSEGAPGSFQARQRLIEAHLKRNTSPDKPSTTDSSNRRTDVFPKAVPSAVQQPSGPPVYVPPGTVPPPPPPPPLPK